MLDYSIYKSSAKGTAEAAGELLESLPEGAVRLVFFVKAFDNVEYLAVRDGVMKVVGDVYGQERPLVTVVAQAPLDCAMALECCCSGEDVRMKEAEGVRYALLGDGCLMTEGILPESLDMPMRRQGDCVFRKLGRILDSEGFAVPSIVRQWNYIEKIVGEKDPGLQNYQQLNDARSEFYATAEWNNGYPAATGIGTQAGGIMVEVDALDGVRCVPIDNALQIAAHSYSDDVLIGECAVKTTPKFERAKAVVGDGFLEYVSGTAAIRGEASLTGVGIERQTVTTLENIEYLFAESTLGSKGIYLDGDVFVSNFRVYLKAEDDYAAAARVLEERYPGVPAVYVLSDVCRDELLIEIECIIKNR